MAQRHILLVEDDADLCDVLTEELVRAGYTVVAVRDGQQALTALDTMEPPALLLCDLLLPYVQGQAVILECQRSFRLAATRIVVLTAVPHLAPSGVRVVAKPFGIEELVDVVREYCGSSA